MKRVLGRLLAAVLTLALLVTPSLALSVEQAVELLEGFYVDTLPPEAYQAETVDELLALLGDPYTEYMTEEEYQRFLSNMEGGEAFVGIGVYIQLTDEGILIDSLIGGGGAEAAGLMAGDVIIAVGGVSCVPAASAHQALILGEEGSYVTLTVRRANGVVSDYLVQRRAVVIP
ncbi:MAG: PDZ domain-containing protein, partial [Oscillospiraceae bacterium]|nr:PDZ domain-containing protein [Oscillospiraceae bacterium]